MKPPSPWCAPGPCRASASHAQRGAAAVEFALLALPLLIATLLVIEGAQWQSARHIAYVALMQAARAGSTGHANPALIQAAFEQALTPLFVPRGRYASAAKRMRARFAAVTRLTGFDPWRIDILSPNNTAFAQFADPRLRVPGAGGRAAIHNDYQAEHYARARSGSLTIFDANVLRLRLTYLHRPWSPWLRALLRTWGDARGDYGARAMASAGLLPIRVDMVMEMQSHPVQWNARGRVTAR